MQHIFEFIAIKKFTPEEELYNKDPENLVKKIPSSIRRYFRTESTRKEKVTKQIYKRLVKDGFLVSEAEKELENFYLKQWR